MKKVLALVFVAASLISCTHEETVRGVVVGHETFANKYGHGTYSTIIKTEDGNVVESTELKYYIEPVGSKVTVKVSISNK
jgi:thiamine pyrophosphokinase